MNFSIPVRGEKKEVYSIEGYRTYRKDTWKDYNGTREEWEILYIGAFFPNIKESYATRNFL